MSSKREARFACGTAVGRLGDGRIEAVPEDSAAAGNRLPSRCSLWDEGDFPEDDLFGSHKKTDCYSLRKQVAALGSSFRVHAGWRGTPHRVRIMIPAVLEDPAPACATADC